MFMCLTSNVYSFLNEKPEKKTEKEKNIKIKESGKWIKNKTKPEKDSWNEKREKKKEYETLKGKMKKWK